jgi:hypothetical protein
MTDRSSSGDVSYWWTFACIIVPALVLLNPEVRKGLICACECRF